MSINQDAVFQPSIVNQPVMKVKHNGHDLMYAVCNDHSAWRVKTLTTKEPDTIAWIDSMQAGETLIDIGANIGIYTVYAAAKGITVHAFEPEAQNYALLSRSLMINEFENAHAYCLALSDEFRLDSLYLSGFLPGGSCHTFGIDLDHRLTARERPAGALKQGCLALPLDQLKIHADHLKLDVDGLEHRVIAGAVQTISKAKSILIEINQNLTEHMNLVNYMQDIGFSYDQEQVETARRKSGTFENCGNWIFTRR